MTDRMKPDEKIITLEAALQEPGRAFQLAEEYGHVLIEQDRRARYVLIDLEKEPQIEMTEDEKLEFVARRILKEYHAAFEALSKE